MYCRIDHTQLVIFLLARGPPSSSTPLKHQRHHALDFVFSSSELFDFLPAAHRGLSSCVSTTIFQTLLGVPVAVKTAIFCWVLCHTGLYSLYIEQWLV